MRTTKLWIPVIALAFGLSAAVGCSDDDNGGPMCGDGVVEGDEECDGNEFAVTDDCESEGYYGGEVSCSASCTVDFSACHNCGDGVKDDDEECDGSDLDGADCISEGFDSGTLSCTNDCLLDTTECVTNTCDIAAWSTESATGLTDEVEWYYEEIVSDGGLYYLFIVDLYDDGSGSYLETGDHTLGTGPEATYADCYYCSYVVECTDSSCETPGAFYFPTEGTMSLDTLGPVGGSLTGGMSSVIYTEWDTDSDEAVTDGACIDVESYNFDFSPLGQANW